MGNQQESISTSNTALAREVLAENKVSLRTRLSYGIGCIGRDANYTLVSNFILTYLTLAVGVTNWQLGAITLAMVIARVWDAVNDPIMGTIIDNTNTRFGKFKPYIICGALLNVVFTILLFTKTTQNEVLFVVIFAVTYILWGMTYTMNDISYWSMLPSLTVDPKEREKITSLARIGANIGLFAVTALVPMITAGGMGSLYRPIAICVCAVFVACQLLVIFGVQEKKNIITAKGGGHAKLRDIGRIVFKNDQLLAIAISILLFNIGYFITASFGVQFFYFDYGHFGGMEFTIFAAVIGAAQIISLVCYPLLAKRMNRKNLFTFAIAVVATGYIGFTLVGYLLPMNMVLLCVIGFILFAGQAIIQLLNYVLLADTVEYGQWKLGTRNESIIFSLNPFITKLASAVQAGVFSLTLIVSGLNYYSDEISKLEQEMSLLSNNATEIRSGIIAKGNEIVAQIPGSATMIMRIAMTVLPLILIFCGYLVFRTRYKLDEKTYAGIIDDLAARAAGEEKK